MILKIGFLVALLIMGCATSPKSDNEIKLNEQKCPEGADTLPKDDGTWTCEYLKDVYLKMSQDEFKKVRLKSSALDLLKAFYKFDPNKVKTHIIKDEMKTKPVFFKIQAPYEKQLNRYGNVRGFVVKYKKAQFFITSYPLYYSKNFENQEVYLRCNLESYTRTKIVKDLFFKNCQIINIENSNTKGQK
jgi:hypothetical protein